MERLGVHLDGKEIYDIVITDSFDGLKEEVGRLRTEGKKLCIVQLKMMLFYQGL